MNLFSEFAFNLHLNMNLLFCICFIGLRVPALIVNITKSFIYSSIFVQWDEVEDDLPTTYIITWTSESDLNTVQVKALIEQSSYTITGLTHDTVYTITVTASNRCGTGPESMVRVIFSAGMCHFH